MHRQEVRETPEEDFPEDLGQVDERKGEGAGFVGRGFWVAGGGSGELEGVGWKVDEGEVDCDCGVSWAERRR